MRITRKISKSVYPIRYPVKGSFNLGEICPIGAPLEVIPGDYFKLEAAMAIRMATPIAPIMDDLDAEVTAHFVPLRLISSKEGDRTGENIVNATATTPRFETIIGNGIGNPADWAQTNHELYQAPTINFNEYYAKTSNYTTIGEALGLGLGTAGSNLGAKPYLAYPLFGYNLIYQTRFRNQNVETARDLDKTSNVNGVYGTNTDITDNTGLNQYNYALNVAYKHGDYFTNCVPSPQKGGAVELPLQGLAPLGVKGTSYTVTDLAGGNNHDIMLGNGSSIAANLVSNTSDVLIEGSSYTPTGTEAGITQTNLYADLTQATAATIQEFVTAYNVQQLLMNDIKGTRYYEIIKNHYGIENDDIRLYIPELLMYRRFAINISPVVQQSGSAAATSATDQGNYLGTTGGYSFTGNKGNMVHHAFGEFGYIYFLIVIRQRRTYGQGVPKMFLRSTRFDFFFPELGRIGYDKVTKEQLNSSERANKDQAFGYEPAWQELRERGFAQAFGFMNPSKNNSLDYWTLTELLPSTPTLSMSFLKEDRSNLARALTIGNTGPDFIMDAIIYGSVSTFVPIGTEPKLFN